VIIKRSFQDLERAHCTE